MAAETDPVARAGMGAQLVDQVEAGVGDVVGIRRREVDERVHVALARSEVVAQHGAEDFKASNAEATTQLLRRLPLVLEHGRA